MKIVRTYRCTISNTIYDPRMGDPMSNIPPGTPFEELPDSWLCPECGASKADFEVASEDHVATNDD